MKGINFVYVIYELDEICHSKCYFLWNNELEY